MSAKGKINKTAEGYNEYLVEFNKIRDKYYEKSKSIPMIQGRLDGESSRITKELVKELKQLKFKYSDVFVDE